MPSADRTAPQQAAKPANTDAPKGAVTHAAPAHAAPTVISLQARRNAVTALNRPNARAHPTNAERPSNAENNTAIAPELQRIAEQITWSGQTGRLRKNARKTPSANLMEPHQPAKPANTDVPKELATNAAQARAAPTVIFHRQRLDAVTLPNQQSARVHPTNAERLSNAVVNIATAQELHSLAERIISFGRIGRSKKDALKTLSADLMESQQAAKPVHTDVLKESVQLCLSVVPLSIM